MAEPVSFLSATAAGLLQWSALQFRRVATHTERLLGWTGGEHPSRLLRFHTFVAVSIACISILGAVVAWSASIGHQQATERDQAALEERALRAQLDARYAAEAQQDVRLVPIYQSGLLASLESAAEAKRIRPVDPRRAEQLDADVESVGHVGLGTYRRRGWQKRPSRKQNSACLPILKP